MTASTIERRRAIFDATGDRRQEQFALASNNVASAPVTLFGGNYVLAQACASFR